MVLSSQLFGYVLQRFNPLKQENDTPAKQMSVICSVQGKELVVPSCWRKFLYLKKKKSSMPRTAHCFPMLAEKISAILFEFQMWKYF